MIVYVSNKIRSCNSDSLNALLIDIGWLLTEK